MLASSTGGGDQDCNCNLCVCVVVAAPQWDAMKLSLMIEEANKIGAKLRKSTVFSR